jgi:hypothetical protein
MTESYARTAFFEGVRPKGCPISARFWQMWECTVLTGRVPHICPMLADVGFRRFAFASVRFCIRARL